eukprot:323544-Pyramimonas_sp.AAC.1
MGFHRASGSATRQAAAPPRGLPPAPAGANLRNYLRAVPDTPATPAPWPATGKARVLRILEARRP